jgi:hypothetical protein
VVVVFASMHEVHRKYESTVIAEYLCFPGAVAFWFHYVRTQRHTHSTATTFTQHTRPHQEFSPTMKTALASALTSAAAITALIHASPAAATPNAPEVDAACGTTVESWMPHTLAGVQWYNNGPHRTAHPTRIDIGTDGIANWRVHEVGETNGHDRVRIEGDSARFRSDRGTGRGDMLDFTLHSPTCDAAGSVVSAHATTHIPFGGGVRTIKTHDAEPLKAI